MHSRTYLRAAWLMVVALLSLVTPSMAQTRDGDAARLVNLMREDNYDFHTTNSPTVFTIHFTGAHLQDIKVVLAIGGDDDADLIIFVTVTEKRRMPVNVDFMRRLLEQNHKVDQVKIAYDKDGDLEVRTDTSMRLADARLLRNVIKQVKDVSDELYGMIQPDLLP